MNKDDIGCFDQPCSQMQGRLECAHRKVVVFVGGAERDIMSRPISLNPEVGSTQ